MKKLRKKFTKWVRDGTIWGPTGTQIDLRSADYSCWITLKADTDKQCESLAATLVTLLNRSHVTV